MNRLPWIDQCQRVCSVLVGLPEMFFATNFMNLASNLNGSGHNDKNKPEEDSHHTFMQRTFTLVTSKALSIDILVNSWYRSRLISSCGQCRFDVNNKVFGDLNWNCLAAWALPCHQSTPLCVPTHSNWPQPRKTAEAVLFRQAYCPSVCGPRLAHVRLFVGLSWLTPQGRTAPKVGHAMIGWEPRRRNYEFNAQQGNHWWFMVRQVCKWWLSSFQLSYSRPNTAYSESNEYICISTG